MSDKATISCPQCGNIIITDFKTPTICDKCYYAKDTVLSDYAKRTYSGIEYLPIGLRR